MTTIKKEFSAVDAAPMILYAKRDANSQNAYPITADYFMRGMYIPQHDTEIADETNSNNITVTYTLSGSTVAIKTIVKVGKVTTVSMVYA